MKMKGLVLLLGWMMNGREGGNLLIKIQLGNAYVGMNYLNGEFFYMEGFCSRAIFAMRFFFVNLAKKVNAEKVWIGWEIRHFASWKGQFFPGRDRIG